MHNRFDGQEAYEFGLASQANCSFGIALVMGLLKKYAPPPPPPPSTYRYDQRQPAEPLPTGVIGAFMWLIGLLLGSSFFALRWANHWWANLDGPAELIIYESAVIWCFFPLFAAISMPWPLTVWLLGREGRTDEADSITNESNRKGGMDSFRVMKWIGLGIALPIAILTVFALPMHLSITASEVRVGRFARWQPERFPFSEVTRITLIDGDRYRDGSFHARRDLFLDFSDGRRLDANAAGDGGDSVPNELIKLITLKTGLPLDHVNTRDDLPKRQP